MIPHQNDPKPPQAFVFWILWFAILNGLVMIQFFIGGGIPKGADHSKPPGLFLAIAAGLAIAAFSIRFVLIPQIKEVPKKLPAMIIGLALSEAIGFLGVFALGQEFPATRLLLFATSIGCILCFAPFYAKPFIDDGRSR